MCPEPLTDPPAGAPCACVLPIKVGIRLSVDLYSFFPLVSDFADEVGSGVNMARRQVRVMGANVAGDQPDKTVVLVHLVPMHVNFDKATALLTFQSLWSKKISLKPSVFGDYEILYVVYPGMYSLLVSLDSLIWLFVVGQCYQLFSVYCSHLIDLINISGFSASCSSYFIVKHFELLH